MELQPQRPIRIVLIDDHAVLRAGLRMIIDHQPGLAVVGEAATRAEALEAALCSPDIILLDLDLGDESGVDLLPELLDAAPRARVILLTGLRDPEIHRRAVALGAMGLVLKEKAIETVLKAIEKVHAGEVWLDRSMIARIFQEQRQLGAAQAPDVEATRVALLTPREHTVIALVCEGLQNKQIAERLAISEKTVQHHLTSIFAKLDIANRLELVIYAYRHGLAALPH